MGLGKIVKSILTVFAVIALVLTGLILKQSIIDIRMNDDYIRFLSNEKYSQKIEVNGIELVKQDISCGYACIEMLASYYDVDITEEMLYEQNNGKISTAIGNGFRDEMNRQFVDFNTIKYKNLSNTQMLAMMHDSLSSGQIVPIEFAAKYHDGEKEYWTLHLALVTAMDLSDDKITVHNPYGYVEQYTIDDFLSAARYDNFENMPFFYKDGLSG